MAARTTRREVLLGAAALALAGTSPINAADDEPLRSLCEKLTRLRRRCQRLARQLRKSGKNEVAWARWSEAVDQKTVLLEAIARVPAQGAAGLVVKFLAMSSELLDDDLILDLAARCRLATFSREVSKLIS